MDLAAGLTLAAIAIPEQMATARLAGFPPLAGFAAFIAGSLAFAALGSSRILSAGADSTIAPICAGSLVALAAVGSPDYVALASMLALLVGAILIAAGLFRMSWIADLLSVPVTTGFLAGISIHIVISQIPTLLGLQSPEGSLLHRILRIIETLPDTNLATLALGLACLASIIVSEKLSSRIPGALITLILASLAVRFLHLEAQGVAVLGDVIHGKLAPPAFPIVRLSDFPSLIALAILIAIVVMVQTAATSRSFAAYDGGAGRVDRDFLGVGAGSVAAGFFGAFPVNASPPRTAIVAETGGRSQFVSLVASAAIAILALFGAKLLAFIPGTALASVLLFIAARIFRLNTMLDILGKAPAEFALVALTAVFVVAMPVYAGVGLSILFSLLHGMWMNSRTRLVIFERVPGTSIWWPEGARSGGAGGEKLEDVLVAGFQAPLFFLNAYQFERHFYRALESEHKRLKLVVLEAGSIADIDFTAAQALTRIARHCRERGITFAIARLESVRAQHAIEAFGVLKELGENRLFLSVDDATHALRPETTPRT